MKKPIAAPKVKKGKLNPPPKVKIAKKADGLLGKKQSDVKSDRGDFKFKSNYQND